MNAPQMDWGAGLQGFRQGKADALQQEANNRANDMNKRQQTAHDKNMTMQDEQIQQLKDTNASFKKLENNRKQISINNAVKGYTAGNAQQSVDNINVELAGMGKKPMHLASYEQTRKSIVHEKGFEMDYNRVVTNEDGSKEVKHYTMAEINDDIMLGGKYEDNAREALANGEKTLDEAVMSIMPYTVASEDDASVISVENIGMMTGSELSDDYRHTLEKRAGMHITKKSNSREFATDRLIQYKKENMLTQGIKEGSKEWNDGLKEIKDEILTQRTFGSKENREQQEEGAIMTGKVGYETFKNKAGEVSDADYSQLVRSEITSKVTETKNYKDTKKDIDANRQTSSAAQKIIDKIGTTKGKIYRGPIEGPLKSLGAMLSSETKWTKTMQDKLLLSFDLDTEIGMLVQGYVKSISGAAVTDAERTFLTKTLTGGDWADPAVVKQKIQGFKNVIDDRQRINASIMGEMGAGATAINTLRNMGGSTTSNKKVVQQSNDKDTNSIKDSISNPTTVKRKETRKEQRERLKRENAQRRNSANVATTKPVANTTNSKPQQPANIFATK